MDSIIKTTPLLTSLDAFRHFQPLFDWNQEEVHVTALSANRTPLETKLMFRGTVDFCLFHPRDILRFTILLNASSFLIAHNHPSGDPTPSEADITITKKLKQAANLLQVEFVDHLVLTPFSFVSLKELGLMDSRKRRSRIGSNCPY